MGFFVGGVVCWLFAVGLGSVKSGGVYCFLRVEVWLVLFLWLRVRCLGLGV